MRRCGEADLAVELLETLHVRDAFAAMPVKSDRTDARGIAQLMRLDWFRPVHCKSLGAQKVHAVVPFARFGCGVTARGTVTLRIDPSQYRCGERRRKNWRGNTRPHHQLKRCCKHLVALTVNVEGSNVLIGTAFAIDGVPLGATARIRLTDEKPSSRKLSAHLHIRGDVRQDRKDEFVMILAHSRSAWFADPQAGRRWRGPRARLAAGESVCTGGRVWTLVARRQRI